MRHVIRQRPDGRGPRRNRYGRTLDECGRVQAGDQSRGGRFDVAFDPRHLTREEQHRPAAHLPGLVEDGRCVHVGVPVHHAEPHELRALEPGDQPQHARLIAPFDLRLKAHEAEVIARQIVLTELHHRVRLTPRPRIGEADRLHRTEAQRIAPAVRHHLDGQASFEEPLLVEIVNGRRFRGDERIVEPFVFLARERAIEIIAGSIVDTASGTVVDALVRLKPDTALVCGPLGLKPDSTTLERPTRATGVVGSVRL